jgi:hypothetical protein
LCAVATDHQTSDAKRKTDAAMAAIAEEQQRRGK